MTDAMSWANTILQLVTMGITTVAQVRAACVEAGWAADDARLTALDAEYDRRIERRKNV